jgi:hypothetical protein
MQRGLTANLWSWVLNHGIGSLKEILKFQGILSKTLNRTKTRQQLPRQKPDDDHYLLMINLMLFAI